MVNLHLIFRLCRFGMYIVLIPRCQIVSASSCPSRTLLFASSSMTWQWILVESSPSMANSFKSWWQVSWGNFLATALSCLSEGVCWVFFGSFLVHFRTILVCSCHPANVFYFCLSTLSVKATVGLG